MSARRFSLRLLLPFWLGLVCAAAPIAPRIVNLTTPDGTILKASYFAAAKPGPGVLLLHQCNQQRKSWDSLAERLAALGVHVLTLDYRGFGESGAPFDKLSPQEKQKLTTETWPGDIDLAFQYLVSQPGVIRDQLGAGGASCGVNNSIQLAQRHPEVKALTLLSGPTDRQGRLFLQSKQLPVFTSVADDDQFGPLVETMQWLFSVSQNAASRFQRYATGRHGAEMFAPHPELVGLIADWFAATLTNKPGTLPHTNGAAMEPQVLRALEEIDQPGGADKIAATLGQPPKANPKAELFPEFIVNLLGYEHLQSGDTKGAVGILKLNALAHPDSANVYDSLSDAYLADGQKDSALQNAKKALDLLPTDTKDSGPRRKGIRESAEQKIKQLAPAQP